MAYGGGRRDQEKDEFAKERAIMMDLDDQGWSHIHYAAKHSWLLSIERFVGASIDQLEFPTNDERQLTPLLIAVETGRLDTVKLLTDLGSDLRYINHLNQGVVELACSHQHTNLLEYYIQLDHKDLPIWERLLKLLQSVSDEEAEVAAKMLVKITTDNKKDKLKFHLPLVQNGAIPIFVKLVKSTISDKAKVNTLNTLLNVIEEPPPRESAPAPITAAVSEVVATPPGPMDVQLVKSQLVESGGIKATLDLFTSVDKELVFSCAQVLCQIAVEAEHVDAMVDLSTIPTLLKVCQSCQEHQVLARVAQTLGLIAYNQPIYRQAIGNTPGCFKILVALYNGCTHKGLLLSLTRAVGHIVRGDADNQKMFVDEGGAYHMVMLASVKNREVQVVAIETIHRLAENNSHTQKSILEEGAVMPIMNLLRRSRAQDVWMSSAEALWALAGEDLEERRTMAAMIGVNLLIEFLIAQTEYDILHHIGAEGLAVLAQGAVNKRNVISHSSGIQPLVRLLRSNKEHIVLSAIRALRYLTVGVGYIPNHKNQNVIAQSRGLRYLVALMSMSQKELIQVESALTLGCCSIGNQEIMSQIQENVDFNYIYILRLLYSKDELVRLLAGSALSAFAFNSVTQQREVAESGGVRYHCFVPFLESNNEFYRCNASFQVVVLSRIIPDEDQASSSAVGIKLLVDLLQDSKNIQIQALAADCIARLAHTRAGVPAAIISINAVKVLCKLLMSPSEQVRGASAIALGFLSHNHRAEREILNRCRSDPIIMKVLRQHTRKMKLSENFLDGWKHYKSIGLPPIDNKPNLVSKKQMAHYLTSTKSVPNDLFMMLNTGEENGMAPVLPTSSPTNLLSTTFPDDANRAPTANNVLDISPRTSISSNKIPPTLTGNLTPITIQDD